MELIQKIRLLLIAHHFDPLMMECLIEGMTISHSATMMSRQGRAQNSMRVLDAKPLIAQL